MCAAALFAITTTNAAAPEKQFEGNGVNASPFTEAETQATMRAFPLLEAAGVRWVRFGFRWSEIERRRGVFSFLDHDKLVDIAVKHHMRIVGVIVRTPVWANGNREEQAPPVDRDAWRNAVRTIIQRYQKTIRHWQIGNEPDIKKFWTGTHLDYLAMLSDAFRAIKEVDPAIQVVSAGLDGYGERYLELLLKHGLGDSCDIVAFHPYGATPEKTLARVQHFRDIMKRYHVVKPLWITEIGWQTGGWPNGPGMARDEPQKADHLIAVYRFLQPLADAIFWYRAVDAQGWYGLIEQDKGNIKILPAYDAYKRMAGTPQREAR